jgi:hypothetical protein
MAKSEGGHRSQTRLILCRARADASPTVDQRIVLVMGFARIVSTKTSTCIISRAILSETSRAELSI